MLFKTILQKPVSASKYKKDFSYTLIKWNKCTGEN
jgi:hypothetical protein